MAHFHPHIILRLFLETEDIFIVATKKQRDGRDRERDDDTNKSNLKIIVFYLFSWRLRDILMQSDFEKGTLMS